MFRSDKSGLRPAFTSSSARRSENGFTRSSARRSENGFTIIELMIAMVFVAFLLVFMALTIVQMLRTYDKAISMKQINQAGRSITEDISQTMRSQLPGAVDVADVNNGLLCIGQTVYHWRPLYTGATLAGAGVVTGGNSHDAIIADPDVASGPTMVKRKWASPTTDCSIPSTQNPSNFESNASSPLLTSRARVLWAEAERNTDGRLVTLRFVIGTYERNEFVNNETKYITAQKQPSNTFSCLPGSSGNYCAFAEFKTIVYMSRN